uniref:Odorant-binding protein 44 n=1 Tax=Matsumurasca onukii TaxID=2912585 RepID=A0A343WGX5_MATON|nr:odorant-binding protein 44 [Matsumurasca onukii]
MWRLLLIFCLAGASVAECLQFDALIQDAKKKAEECKEKTGAQEDIESSVNNLQVPTSPEGKCMVACVFEEMGLMKGEHMDADAIYTFVKTSAPNLPLGLSMMASVTITKCTQGGSSSDKCENAAEFLNCIAQAAKANEQMLTAMMG